MRHNCIGQNPTPSGDVSVVTPTTSRAVQEQALLDRKHQASEAESRRRDRNKVGTLRRVVCVYSITLLSSMAFSEPLLEQQKIKPRISEFSATNKRIGVAAVHITKYVKENTSAPTLPSSYALVVRNTAALRILKFYSTFKSAPLACSPFSLRRS